MVIPEATEADLYDLDWVSWTPEKLRRRIAETEALLSRIGAFPSDPDLDWLRPLLERDVAKKRSLLQELESDPGAGGRERNAASR